jgi:5-methyltetrahydropteroyltriglutamate--homocysteine methyltransferase
VGLNAITDGECRRAFWHYDFLIGLDGVEYLPIKQRFAFKGAELPPMYPTVVGKLGFSNHPFLEHFRFVKDHTNRTPKLTIPSPSALHFRGGRMTIPASIYPDMDEFFADLGKAYGKAVKAFADAGCRYLQLDEVFIAYLCDPEQRKTLTARGEDPDKMLHVYADLINAAVKDAPADMVTSMHLCRGNFKSTFVASGGYEPVADVLFNQTNVTGYFMEYDSDRAGDFAPLRFLPKGQKQAVLGLLTSKSGELESKDVIKRRIEEATKYVPLDQICLSTQCGFASTEEGNAVTEAQQWAKLARVVEVAQEMWA